MSEPRIKCPHKIKGTKPAFAGETLLFPEYDDITEKILMKEGVLKVDSTDYWYFENAHPDFVDQDDPNFWAQVEKIEKS